MLINSGGGGRVTGADAIGVQASCSSCGMGGLGADPITQMGSNVSMMGYVLIGAGLLILWLRAK